MIVNSSRGGGSKDTWVLEDGDDGRPRGPADRRHAAAGAAGPALRRVVGPAAATTATAGPVGVPDPRRPRPSRVARTDCAAVRPALGARD